MKREGLHVYFLFLFLLLVGGCHQESTLFTQMESNQSKITFTNKLTETDSININEYLYAYNGGGVGVGDFNNDGLADLYFTGNQVSNKLYINQGDFVFEDRTESAGVAGLTGSKNWTTGVTIVDINSDGWQDIYISQVSDGKRFEGHNLLYVNNKNGTFTEKAKDYGLDLKGYGQQGVFFDYDGDGDLDLFQLNHSVHELDVYVKANKRTVRDSLSGDRLLRNDQGAFVDVSEQAGIYGGATGYGLSVLISDVDENGCPDIYVSNDFHDNDYLYYNQCDGSFKEGIETSMDLSSNFSMGSDAADINNDGLIDIMTLDMKPEKEVVRKSSAGEDPYYIYEYKKSFGFGEQGPRNMLHLNQGGYTSDGTTFSELARYSGIEATDWSWSVLLADYDNDGNKDIFITNGILRRPNDLDYINYDYPIEVGRIPSLRLTQKMPPGKVTNYAYKNTRDLKFEDVSKEWGLDLLGCSMGAAYADFDNDGDLDLVVNNLDAIATLYKNNAENLGNKYLKVNLQGNVHNPFGIGAKVKLKVGGETMVQEMYPVRGWLSSSEPILNFGLGTHDKIDSLEVLWPDGKSQRLNNIEANSTLHLQYKNASLVEWKKEKVPAFFVPVLDSGIDFVHKENKFIDFNVESLLPHKLSTEGPALCVGDVNQDGLDDIFVGGASGQASVLYLQKHGEGQPRFEKMSIPAFELDQEAEDVAAQFFDADQDGDLDLYVVAGSGEQGNTQKNQDRLYRNSNGNFERDDAFPRIVTNGSSVVAEDFDLDGNIDLFVGARSIPGSYGYSPESYIIWNNGEKGFQLESNNQTISRLGMVTDAVWDKVKKELWVVGEWMPITRLTFSNREIQWYEVPDSSGWWNSVSLGDMDGDGTDDLILGNVGENSGLEASEERPLKLLVKDWDLNGQVDPILVQYKDGKERVFNSLDELKKQMPFLARRFNRYADFADKSVDEIFTKEMRSDEVLRQVVTLKSQLLMRTEENEYKLQPLESSAQMAPINDCAVHDYNLDGKMDLVYVGNLSGFAPSLGRISASFGGLLLSNDQDSFENIPPKTSGFHIVGDAKVIKSINVGLERWILIGVNNGELRILKSIGK